jgi:hypothetical protein
MIIGADPLPEFGEGQVGERIVAQKLIARGGYLKPGSHAEL